MIFWDLFIRMINCVLVNFICIMSWDTLNIINAVHLVNRLEYCLHVEWWTCCSFQFVLLGHSLRDDYHRAWAVLVFRTASLKYSCCGEISTGAVKQQRMSSHPTEGEKVHQQQWDSKDDGQICPLYLFWLSYYSAFKATLTAKGLTCFRLYYRTIVFFSILCFPYIMLSLWVRFGKSHISIILQSSVKHPPCLQTAFE